MYVITSFEGWNQHPGKQTVEYDKRMISALLTMLVCDEKLARSEISEEIRDFIMGKYLTQIKPLKYYSLLFSSHFSFFENSYSR